jgi:hypothetical protein
MTGNWLRPPRAERRPRWKLRLGLTLALVVAVLGLVGAANIPGDVSVGTNLGPTPCDQTIAGACARHLTTTTTRVVPTTTVPVYGPEVPDFVVIDGEHVIHVPRTPLTARLLWLAQHAEGER